MKGKFGMVIALAIFAVMGIGQAFIRKTVAASEQTPTKGVPKFAVDPYWPKPLPDHFVLGELGGVGVDAQDHVWIVNRTNTLTDDLIGEALKPPTSECCMPAPPIIEFDAQGNYVQGFGGPGKGYEFPASPHGITVDYKGNVWIGGNAPQPAAPKDLDTQILKFTNKGQFLMQIGRANTSHGSLDTENLNRPTQVAVWPKTNEAFVSDGYNNRRVIVFDADTGKFKRMWGAYGNKPDDSAPQPRSANGKKPPQFDLVHGVTISNEGLVYVCDRINDRIQVFTLEGKFVKEAYIHRETTDTRGTAFNIAFSPDKAQKFMYVPNGASDKIEIMLRDTLEIIGEFGRGGEYAGEWHWLHSIASDSKGNLYTGESRGNRVQKFVFKGYE